MRKNADLTRIVAASDVVIEHLHDGRLRIETGDRSLIIETELTESKRLMEVFEEVLPRLVRSLSLAEQLTHSQQDAIQPFLEDLIGIGVLFRVNTHINTGSDRDLYTFLARRSSSPDEAFENVTRQAFHVEAPMEIKTAWRQLLSQQGLTLTDDPTPGTSIVMVVTFEPEELLDRTYRYHREGQEWVPVLITRSGISIGPWTSPGESSCVQCNPTAERTGNGAGVGARSWISLQPSAVAWAGGVLAAQALRAVAPIGPYHPWGRVTNLDILRCKQQEVSTWKNPFCPVCGPDESSQPAWIETHV